MLQPLPRLISAFHCIVDDGRAVGSHTHRHHELVFIRQGQLTVTTPSQRVHAAPGDVQLFPAGTAHDQVSRGAWHTVCAQFSASIAPEVRVMTVGLSSVVRIWMEQLSAFANAATVPVETQDALLSALLAHVRQLDHDREFSQSLNPILSQATRLLQSRLDRDFDASAFARELLISPGHLASLFRTRFGCSPMKWHHGLRMERARSLLGNPYVSVKAVATELGFHDLNYFVRRFRAFTGVSPGRWRHPTSRAIQRS